MTTWWRRLRARLHQHWTDDPDEVRAAPSRFHQGGYRLYWAGVTPRCRGCGQQVLWLDIRFKHSRRLPLWSLWSGSNAQEVRGEGTDNGVD